MDNSEVLQKQKFGNSQRYRVWLAQAGYDLKAAKDSLNAENFEWATYQSVQSVEKLLKSVIIHSGWRPPQTHKLGILLSLCNQANKSFINVKLNFRRLEVYTFIARYPFVYPGENLAPHDLINRKDAVACIAISEEINTRINQFFTNVKEHTNGEVDLEHYFFSSEEIQSRLDSVVNLLKDNTVLSVKKIILFGSFARKKLPPKTSTMDILVVADTVMPFLERMQYVRDITKDSEPIIEPLVYTSNEFDYMLNHEGEGYIESAIEEGRVIFEA